MRMEDPSRSEGTIRLEIANVRDLSGKVVSRAVHVRNLPWRIVVMPRVTTSWRDRYFGFYLHCDGDPDSPLWCCSAYAELQLVSYDMRTHMERVIQHEFYNLENDWGFSQFMLWSEVVDPKNGFLWNNTIIVEVYLKARNPTGIRRIQDDVTCKAATNLLFKLTAHLTDRRKRVSCPNELSGCPAKIVTQEVIAHVKECTSRQIACPHGKFFGQCPWEGKVIDLLAHFKDRHVDNCKDSFADNIVLENIDIKTSASKFFLVPHDNMLFITTFQINIVDKTVFWTVQRIGSEDTAKQYLYQIYISDNEAIFKSNFIQTCFSEATKPDDAVRQGKCKSFPFDFLSSFIQDKKIAYRVAIKKAPNQEG